MENKIVSSLALELRRGTIVLCVLSQLSEKKYGYALVQCLEEKGLDIEPNTLYPLLRRLEKQGLLKSEWELSDTKPRKYYMRTAFGDEVYVELQSQWSFLNQIVERIVKEE